MLSSAARPYIQASVPVLQAHGLAITTTFYSNMFQAHPELKNLFNMGNQANGSQQQSLAAAVFAYAANIDNASALQPVIDRIVHKHAAVGIKPAHYPIVGRHLLGAIAEVLGEAATPPLIAAWDEAYWLLAGEFIAAEARLYQRTGYAADQWIDARITEVTPAADGILSLVLAAEEQALPAFKAGQYISVAVTLADGARQIRQYSLSDAEQKSTYRISVKREAGDTQTPQGTVSSWLHQYAQVDGQLRISHPYGELTPVLQASTPLVLISAGVGITPMLSMLKTLQQAQTKREVWFLHAARTMQHVPHLDELMASAEQLSSLNLALYIEDKPGFATERLVREGHMRVNEWPFNAALNAQYYLCGPLPFMVAQWQALLAMGIPPQHIHREVFGPESLNQAA
ncbi:globin domain-containing protein [Methylophilus sp.]|uniref:globin domain-containing protein n=1 Tax=Methylophilus sp. TaxID=29541 RepID=UPI0011D397E8|nr:globin domain-containing protein [Methylophilus sp.]TXI44436.1 MAG: flavohemoprotein [Methylophilus sp.]